MKRTFLLICICSLIATVSLPTLGQAKPDVSGKNAVLIDQESGRVLFEKRAHEKQPIASITKVMTAIIAIESGQMDERAAASKRAIFTEGSSIYLEKGEKMAIKDLVYGLMLRSGNDASVSISEHIGGSVEGFVYLMNEKARWLGMNNTHFTNPHGLDDEEHYSTAYDMAILMRYAMQNDVFRKVTGTKTYKAEKRAYAWQNKNKLLTSLYDRCIGGKTGFTKVSGRTLVSAAKKNDMELIIVTLNAPDDWRDHIYLFEWGFKQYNMKKYATKGNHTYTVNHMEEPITGTIKKDVNLPLMEDEIVTKQTYIHENAVKENRRIIGTTTYYVDNEQQEVVSIYSAKDNPQKEGSFLDLFHNVFKHMTGIGSVW